jgi:ABC-type uncharacterized transport system auxiliary subunit
LLWCTALLTILAALITFFFVGCGAARPAKFYQLTVAQGTASPAPADSYPVGILIGPLFASHLYREDHIVFSSKGESMGTYEYERWVEPPTEMIQQVLFRALRSSGRFRSVHAQRSSSRGDYVLQGHLYSFEEVTGSPLAARLSLDIELRDSKTGSAVWSHVYNHDEPVSGKNISAVVAALDHNVQRATDEITAGLFQYFSAHPPAVPAGPGAAQ